MTRQQWVDSFRTSDQRPATREFQDALTRRRATSRVEASRVPAHASRWSRVAGPILIALLVSSAVAGDAGNAIPESAVHSLRKELATSGGRGSSTVATRRNLKNIVRKGHALLKEAPVAPNRYAILGIMFQSQKRLLTMDNIARNRDSLFDTCGKLAQAPDRYAELRLEADLLLSERELSGRDATLDERAKALAELLERYRGTSAEARSLLMGALIVQKLEAPELEDAIYYALDENFSDDHDVIEFRRKFLKISRLDVTFSGEFERLDGTILCFPADTMGHLCLMVFWSKEKRGFEEYLEKRKEELAKYAGLIDVFSFNLDELPDGGASILRDHGLDWTVMRLPGGRQHQAYRTYAQGDPIAVLVNEYGLAVIRPEIVHGRLPALEAMRVSEDRYMAQLQSLFIGDILVTGSATDDKLPAVQACFPLPPFRYRLSREEALANYGKAEKLCADAIKKAPNASGLWRLRNRRIVALLGMWNLACEPEHLEAAVAEAEAALAMEPPPAADVVPRFCLAKDALRRGDKKAASAVSGFLAACGGDDAPASALAAAAMLALDAKSREMHEKYRGILLEEHADSPEYYAFTSFLLDRHHRYRLLKPNHSRRERSTRSYIVNHGYEPMTNRLPRIALKRMDGSTLSLPREGNDKPTFLVFVEPPADPDADFPVLTDRRGNPTRNDHVRMVMDYAQRLVDEHVNKGVDMVAAFLCDDAAHVDALMKTNGWTCQAAMVPGGLNNPMVRQLGILSADRVANVFLLRRDGTVAWRASGLAYRTEFGFPFAFLLGMKVHIEVCDVEAGYRALEKGDFQGAARLFTGPYLPADPDRYGWRSSRHHGRAIALMGLKDWEPALEAIEIAIDAHTLRHYRGRGAKGAKNWRQTVADFTVKEPCDILSILWSTHAAILDELGRKEEAAVVRRRAAGVVAKDYEDVYKLFHEKLKTLRVRRATTRLVPAAP